jgi:hypothetical protein
MRQIPMRQNPEFKDFTTNTHCQYLIALAVDATRELCFKYQQDHLSAATNNWEVAKKMRELATADAAWHKAINWPR